MIDCRISFIDRDKRLIKILLLFGLIFFPGVVYGQDGKTSFSNGISSPTAASLGKYGNSTVSLFTGSPRVRVPVFDLKGRKLTLPIILNYNSSGILVEEIPGWAGLGWSLNAGGVITRTVRGIPDDRSFGYLGSGGDSTEVHLRNASIPTKDYLREVYSFNLDGEPDQYFFNFGRFSGKIFMARDESKTPYHYRPYTSPQQDIKIKFQIDNGLIKSWIITTEDGTRYTFSQLEQSSQTIGGRHTTYTSSWYLTKIKSASGNDAIQLTYESDTGASILQRSETAFDPLPNGGCTPDDYYSDFTTSSSSVYLRRIETANHTAVFERASRTDGGGMRLNSIEISNTATSTPIRSYELVHGYYNVGGTQLEQRLRLDRVRQYKGGVNSTGELPSWYFAYDNSYLLPPRDSNALDYWGFYNGEHSNSGLAPRVTYNGTIYGSNDREPSESHSLTGVLTKVKYPTGGETNLIWEGHRYGDNTVGGGVRIKRMEIYDGIDVENNQILKYEYSNGQLLVNPKMYVEHSYTIETSQGTQSCHYLSRTSTSYVAPGMMNGSVIMYPKVTIIRGASGEDGKSVKTYGIPQVLNMSTYTWPYVPKVVESWRGGGSINSEKELNSSNQKLKKQDYDYMSLNEKSIWGIVVSRRTTHTYPYQLYEYPYNDYMVNNGVFLPVRKTNYIYNPANTGFMTDTVKYDYGNLPQLVQETKTTKINSNGQVRKTEYSYAHEQYPGMNTAHMLSQPYKVSQKDGAGSILRIDWTLWKQTAAGNWVPCARYVGGHGLGTTDPDNASCQ